MAVTTVAAACAPQWALDQARSTLPASAAGRRRTAARAFPSARQQGFGLLQRVGGSELRLLDGEPDASSDGLAGRPNCIRPVSDDDRERAQGTALRAVRRTCSSIATASDSVQHLGQAGLHPRALTRGQDDDMNLAAELIEDSESAREEPNRRYPRGSMLVIRRNFLASFDRLVDARGRTEHALAA